MSQKVKREDRLRLPLMLLFPNINEGKSYKDKARKFHVAFDGEDQFTIDQEDNVLKLLNVRLRTVITIAKKYGDKAPDSIFIYRVGENFVELTNQKGEKKRVAVSFKQKSILRVLHDVDFKNVLNIL